LASPIGILIPLDNKKISAKLEAENRAVGDIRAVAKNRTLKKILKNK